MEQMKRCCAMLRPGVKCPHPVKTEGWVATNNYFCRGHLAIFEAGADVFAELHGESVLISGG